MSNPLITKLRQGAKLDEVDCERIASAVTGVRRVSAHVDLLREGSAPANVHVVFEGVACRYKLLPDGRRSITAYLLPGDFCDLHFDLSARTDFSISTLTACQIAEIPAAGIDALCKSYPRISHALMWTSLVDAATARSWLVSIGRKSAGQRIAHLFCEFLCRLKMVGLAGENTYQLPLTQEELADASGITPVHVNRVIQQLREMGLIDLKGRIMTIFDVDQLRKFAQFDETYLHLCPRTGEEGAGAVA